MANYFYVKDGLGTRPASSDTTFTALESGAFGSGNLIAANVYASIKDAVDVSKTTDPLNGDFIIVSDAHDLTYGAGNFAIGGAMSYGDFPGLRIVSVDDSNADTYSPGAHEYNNNGSYYPKNNISFFGVNLTSAIYIFYYSTATAFTYVQDAELKIVSAGDYIFYPSVTGVGLYLHNVDIGITGTGGNIFRPNFGCEIIWDGGSITGTFGSVIEDGKFDAGGGSIIVNGVDMSGLVTSNPLIGNCNASTDAMLMRLTNCELPVGITLHGTLDMPFHRFEMFNCDDGTDDDYHRFYTATGMGTAQNNDATYVTTTEAWYAGTAKSSIEVITTADCSSGAPFIFDLPAQYMDLSAGGYSKVTIDLITTDTTTAITLTDTDIAAFLVYPDATTAVEAHWKTSGKTVGAGNYGIDPLATGTELDSSSLGAGDWEGELSDTNYYKMEIDIGTDIGQATGGVLRIEVYKEDITAGELFINTEVTLS